MGGEEFAKAVDHVVTANARGQPVSPLNYWRRLDQAEYDQYLDNILSKLDGYVGRSKNPRVLLFIHGGLNVRKKSLRRALGVINRLETSDDPEDNYFPMFVVWRSGLLSSYFEHLLSLRRGKSWPILGGLLTAPLVLIADIGRSVGRALMVWVQMGLDALATYRRTPPKHIQSRYEYLQKHSEFRVSLGKYCGPGLFAGKDACGSKLEGTVRTFIYIVTFPFKALFAPLLDGFGRPAWDVMCRRAELLRRQPGEFEAPLEDGGSPFVGSTGAVSVFLDKLAQKLSESRYSEVEMTVVGHSMGTIVANWAIGEYGERLHLSNIVYMAAACTIRDFEGQVIPYLSESDTHFFNLTLHPKGELRETNAFEIPPRGSLLVWIDRFLSNPVTVLDRTLGRWDNIIPAIGILPESVGSRVTVKAFGVTRWFTHEPESNPQKHGEFTNGPFWRESYWI